MASAELFASDTASDTGAVQTLADGVSKTIVAFGKLERDEEIAIEIPDHAGTSWQQLTHVDEGGNAVQVEFTHQRNTIKLTGPLEWRWNKPVTDNAIEILEYA